MENGIAQFQSLSRCEAARMCVAVTSSILNAYEAGFNVAVSNYDKSLDDLFVAHRAALEAIGFGHISFADAMRLIKTAYKEDTKCVV